MSAHPSISALPKAFFSLPKTPIVNRTTRSQKDRSLERITRSPNGRFYRLLLLLIFANTAVCTAAERDELFRICWAATGSLHAVRHNTPIAVFSCCGGSLKVETQVKYYATTPLLRPSCPAAYSPFCTSSKLGPAPQNVFRFDPSPLDRSKIS